jgi:integrase
MRGDGRVYRRGSRWWIEYWIQAKQHRESAGRTEAEAKRKLTARRKEICGDRFVGPAEEKLTLEQLADALIVHLKTKGAKAVPSFESHLKPIREEFGALRAIDLATTRVERFIEKQLTAGKAPATINRQVGALKQALNLARKQGRLSRVPYLPSLREDNARQGFFEKGEFEALAAHLPDPVADVARFAYLSGWRRGEILPLRWDAVDRAAGEIRLRTSKSGHGRVLPLEGELSDLIERRWGRREFETKDGTTALSLYVFHRAGQPLVDIRKVWSKGCKKAGIPGKLFHDLPPNREHVPPLQHLVRRG